MIDLLDITLLIMATGIIAWLWRGHGIRERALLLARRHCSGQGVELLDGNVAFRTLKIQRDRNGYRRLARLYDFEFTVTGEQRLHGTLSMFGQRLGTIMLEPHIDLSAPQEVPPVITYPPDTATNVIQLHEWKQRHQRRDD